MKKTTPRNCIHPPMTLTVSMYLLFFCYALSATITGPLVPRMMAQYDITLSQSGLVSLLIGLGGALGIITGGLISDRFKKPVLIHAAVYTYSITLIAMYFTPSFIWLLAMFFFMGFCTRILDTAGNGYLADIHEHKRSLFMSLMHASYALGAVAGPILTSTVLADGGDWQRVFLVIGFICFFASIFYTIVQLRTRHVPLPMVPPSDSKKFFWIRDKQFYVLCAMSFVYCGFTAALAAWMPTFMQKELSADTMLSGLPVSLLWVGLLCGRLVYPAIISRFGAKRVFLVGSVLTCIIYGLSLIINSPVFYVAAFFLPGFLLGNIVPFAIVLGCSWHRSHSGAVSSYILMSGTLGFLMLPWLFGYVSDAIGLYGMIISCAVMPVILLVLCAMLPGESEGAVCDLQTEQG